jgi:transcriptional regulator with XRE-family HTH domain
MSRQGRRHDESEEAPVKLIIAARIREAQAAKGLKTEDLATRAGISLRLVQKHRAGDNAPGDASLRRYANALGKPLSYFFTGDPLQKEVAA